MQAALRILAAVALLTGFTGAQEPTAPKPTAPPKAQPSAEKPSAEKPAQPAEEKAYKHVVPYPLTTCVVSGEKLEGDEIETFQVSGRTFKTCCPKCKPKVEADAAKYIAKLDAAIVAAQLPTYALKTCPISGKELGSMGAPHQLVLADTLVQLCCKNCVKKATDKTDEVVGKVLDATYAKQVAAYPLKKCVVSDEDIDDEEDVLYGTALVRFCCEKCVKKFSTDSATYLTKIEKARTAKESPKTDPPAPGRKGEDEPTAMATTQQAGATSCCSEAATATAKKSCCCSATKAAATAPAKID